MKLFITLAYTLVFSSFICSQSFFEIENIDLSSQFYLVDFGENRLNSLFKSDRREILNRGDIGNRVEFDKDHNSPNMGLELLVGIKKRGKIKSKNAFQSFSAGLSYQRISKNGLQFRQENGRTSNSFGNPWIDVFLGSSSRHAISTTYEFQSDIVSLVVQEMLWISPTNYAQFAIGIKSSLGVEMQSKIIENTYSESTSSSIWGKETNSTLQNTQLIEGQKGVIGSLSVPVICEFKLLENDNSFFSKMSLLLGGSFGTHLNLFADKNKVNFLNLNAGLRIKL